MAMRKAPERRHQRRAMRSIAHGNRRHRPPRLPRACGCRTIAISPLGAAWADIPRSRLPERCNHSPGLRPANGIVRVGRRDIHARQRLCPKRLGRAPSRVRPACRRARLAADFDAEQPALLELLPDALPRPSMQDVLCYNWPRWYSTLRASVSVSLPVNQSHKGAYNEESDPDSPRCGLAMHYRGGRSQGRASSKGL